MTTSTDQKLHAILETSMGQLVLDLYEDQAPGAVATFVGLARGDLSWRDPQTGEAQIGKPAFDGTTFHRVFANFLVQGGDPATRSGAPELQPPGNAGVVFEEPPNPELHFDRPGQVAFVGAGRTGLPTGSPQFFITEVALPHLNGVHAIFGEVVRGFERIPKIARVEASTDGRPRSPVHIHRVTIQRGPF